MKDPLKAERKEATKSGIGDPKKRDLESDRKAATKSQIGGRGKGK